MSETRLEDKLARLTPAQRQLYRKRLAERRAEAREARRAGERIPRRPDGAVVPLSFSQQRLWFLERLEAGNAAYHISSAVRLEGDLDEDAFEGALGALVRRHESLRTVFTVRDGKPVQEVLNPDAAAGWGTVRRVSGVEPIPALARDEARRPFDLSRGPLFRVALARLGEHSRVLLLTFHHIVSDGWSLALFVRELLAAYRDLAAGRPVALPEAEIQYPDYALWQRQHLSGDELERQLGYWRERLADAGEPLDLPTDRPRPPLQTFAGAKVSVEVAPEAVGRLRRLGKDENATLFMLLLAAWSAELGRQAGQGTVSVGTPVANRQRSETERVLGFFVNTLVMRTDISGDPTFRELVTRTKEVALGAYAHQDLPFERLVEELHPRRDLSRSPLFQVQLAVRNTPKVEASLPGLDVALVPPASHTAQFDLTLSASEVGEAGERLVLSLEHNTDLFDGVTAHRMVRHLRRILEAASAAPDTPLSGLPRMSTAERHRLLFELNDTDADLGPEDATLDALVRARAAAAPDATAVTFTGPDGEPRHLSYAGLVARADAQAARLRSHGIGPETLVGVVAERSLELSAALLAVTIAGGAYVPLDPGYPEDRLRFMAEDSGVTVILAPFASPDAVPAGDARVLPLDGPETASPGDLQDASAAQADGAAYMIYTSGSTGRPKGAVNSHRAIVNRIRWMQAAYGLEPGDAVLQKTPASFDVSVWELFWPLATGARLVMAKPEGHKDPVYLASLVGDEGGTTLHFVPSMLRPFVEQRDLSRCRSLRRVIASGEALPRDLVERFYERLGPAAPTARLHNLYGPTEAAVDVTVWPTEPGVRRDQVPVGRPISNLRVHVYDRSLRPAVTGEPGELLISGVGLARGYRRRPALTAERFVPDPLAGVTGPAGGRAYRTGDLVRTAPEGEIEFLGRLDHQVKVRGFRIELGEIEAALLDLPEVGEAVVVDRKTPRGDVTLAAYVAPPAGAPGPRPETDALRRALAAELPAHMVPGVFVVLDALPLSPNGKVDRKALPEPAAARTASAPAGAPAGRLERRLVEVWKKVLGVETVGVGDNFFDLGGHSLLLVEVQAALAEMGHEVEMVELFQHPTVAGLARFLSGGRTESDDEVVTAPAVSTGAAGGRREVTDIAITAVAGRFPGAGDVDELWRNLMGGVESIRRLTREEMLADGADPREVGHPSWVPAWGVLDDIDRFDARFFGFSPREAQILDPQHRLFLEHAWETLERGGLDPDRFAGRIGVFAGASMSSYAMRNLADNADLVRDVGVYQAMIGNDKDYVATRTAYTLGLRGPAMGVQTACSTSLVAVLVALQALRAGHCDAALAGGVSVKAQQRAGYRFQEGHILSPDGHCRAFDAAAAGTVGGSGVALVLLRPLAAALADGDPVLAVLKGGAFNNDGDRKVGFTAPSVQGQAEVLAAAYDDAGVDPATVGYVETHGTGTPLGDPIELAGLRRAFGRSPKPAPEGSCALGSVKTNLGHLDAAAGATGLIKAVLTLDREEVPPSLHFTEPNPDLGLEGSPFRIAAEAAGWPRGESEPRRAGVSSFGIGGTNAHVVLEEAPAREPSGPSRALQPYLVSARDGEALERGSHRLAEHFGSWVGEEGEAADAAYTLAVGRKGFEHRRAVVAASPAEAAAVWAGQAGGRLDGVAQGERPVAFLFPGQGAQHPGMGRGLYEAEPVFRRALDRCAEVLEPHLDLRGLLYPEGEDREGAAARLAETRHTQPAVFAVEWALAELGRSWGVTPWAMAGHSIGELTAACLAGVLTLEDALELVAERGRLLQALPPGGMLSIPEGEDAVAARLESTPELSVAAINAPGWTVVAGPDEAIEGLRTDLETEGVDARVLRTSHAFHSPMMEPARAAFEARVAAVTLSEPRIPFVSNVTGDWIRPEEATDPAYWGRHLRRPVRFADGLATLLAEGGGALLEVGPGRALTTLARQHPEAADTPVVTTLGAASRDDGEDPSPRRVLEALGRLWASGVTVDWRGFYGAETRRKVVLPTYPFARERHWVERRPEATRATRKPPEPVTPGPDAARYELEVRGPRDAALTVAAALWPTGARVAWRAPGEAAAVERRPDLVVLAAGGPFETGPMEELEAVPREIPLAVVTRGGRAVLAEEIDPAMAEWGVAASALGRRRPTAWIDLPAPADTREADAPVLATQLLTLAASPTAFAGDEPAAVRGGRLWQLAPLSVERPEEPEPVAPEPPTAEATSERPDAPVTATERAVARIWTRLLGVAAPGRWDDFFELGGHSLLATRVASRIRDDLGVDLPLEALFETPTLEGLAARVDEAGRFDGATAPADAVELVALDPAARRAGLPLSFGQQRMWFLHQLQPTSPFYNISSAVGLTGSLRVRAFAAALAEILRRHEALRTRFALDPLGGEPVQRVDDEAALPLPVIDLRRLPEPQRAAALQALSATEAARPFDLNEAPVVRAVLGRLGAERWTVLLTVHHVASDAWSLGVLTRELSALYGAFADGDVSPLEELPVQYGDYAAWQRALLSGERRESQVAYWRDRFTPLPPALELPTDRPRPAVQTFDGGSLPFALGSELSARLQLLGGSGTTLFMVLAAAFKAMLARTAGQNDVTVGTPIAGRRRSELEEMIGFFVNSLALRTDLSGDPGFDELLGRVRETALGAQAHQDLPFETLVEEIQPPRDLSRTPLFQVFFALQNVPPGRVELDELTLTPADGDHAPARFDLTVFAYESPGPDGGVWGRWVYNRRLFDATTVGRLARRFETVLAAVADDPTTALSRLPLTSPAERHQILVEQAGEPRASGPRLLHEWVRHWAETTPEAPAVVYEDTVLDYRTLASRAGRLASALRRRGPAAEDRVGLFLPRSAEMIVALLGVLEAGACYVPLEVGMPEDRLRGMTEDADVRLLVTGDETPPVDGVPVLSLAEIGSEIETDAEPITPPIPEVHPDQLAYVLFTSGSTGRPKGVAVTHGNLVAYTEGVLERLDLPAGSSFASVSTLAADLGNTSVFGALMSGGALHVLSAERVGDPEAVADYGEHHEIDVLKVVPSHLVALQASSRPERVLPKRRLLLGGEALGWEEVRQLTRLAPTCRVLNHYGPTEATVGVLTHTAWKPGQTLPETPAAATVPLGRPLPAARVVLSDRLGEPTPLGAVGELLLGGISVTRGYLGRPGLTAERFVPDPYASEPGARLYRTGDLGRRLPTGEIEFLGRADRQVKIRGFRIELGEVQASLVAHEAVREAVAEAREYGPGDRRLVAWVVTGDPTPSVEELQAHLRRRLPEYMTPSAFVFVDALPLTANGKVDRRALPDPQGSRPELAARYAAPTNDLERTLAEVWREALQVDRVGRSDNFFDLGGHSLLLVKVAAELRRRLDRPELPLTALFENPTVAELARHLSKDVRAADAEPAGEALESRLEAGRDRRRLAAERRKRAARALQEV